MTQAITDYYRCPENLADFQLVGKLSADPGYFHFGSETVCYGNSSSGSRSKRLTARLYDALADVSIDNGTLRLPMDPNEIIENLRHERYRNNASRTRPRLDDSRVIRRLYYHWLRPLLPIPMRRHLQRARLRNWKNIPFPNWPVDRTVERILERILALSMKAQGIRTVPFVWFWPESAMSCAIMTHDVEYLAGLNFCPRLMDLDDSVGIKSSFQIVPDERYPSSEGLFNEIRGRGFELNIHDLNHDGDLFVSHEEFLRRAEQINEYGRKYGALGFRSGALYRNQEWYGALEFSYDMSVPSVAHLDPQRGGCCSLMPFFIGRVLELPLTTTQDYSLFHILNDYSLDLWKRQVAAITGNHGLASFIVHPDYVIEKRARATYQGLLEHLVQMREEKRVWIALPREVDSWWRERSQMKVVCDGDRWHIEGKGRERARLAFATLVGDEEVAYSIEEQR